MRPYTKSYAAFHRPRGGVRVAYWFEAAELAFHFDWPADLVKLGMPKEISVKNITLEAEDITKPEFANPVHVEVAKRITRILQVASSRAANLIGMDIDLSAQTKAPTFGQVEQLNMEML